MAERLVFADPIAVAVLRLAGLVENISTEASGADSQLPAARVTVVSDLDVNAPWSTPTVQVDVWAEDASVAGQLATDLATFCLNFTARDVDDAYVSGVWLESRPRPFPDNDTHAARYLFEFGLRIHPEESK